MRVRDSTPPMGWLGRLGDNAGQGLVEYVLIIALASIVVIVALVLFGTTIQTNWYDSITSGLNRMGS